MEFTLSFVRFFMQGMLLIWPLIFFFFLIVFILGQLVGRIEHWSKFDAFYWSFITALTVGYGDIPPLKKRSKSLSILIALLGIMFTGIIVVMTVATATRAFEQNI